MTDLNERRHRIVGEPFGELGMAAYVIERDTGPRNGDHGRITTVDSHSPDYASFEEFQAKPRLNDELSEREYSMSTRGLRPNLVETPSMRRSASWPDLREGSNHPPVHPVVIATSNRDGRS